MCMSALPELSSYIIGTLSYDAFIDNVLAIVSQETHQRKYNFVQFLLLQFCNVAKNTCQQRCCNLNSNVVLQHANNVAK